MTIDGGPGEGASTPQPRLHPLRTVDPLRDEDRTPSENYPQTERI